MGNLLNTLVADYKRNGGSLRSTAFWAMATYRFGRWVRQWPPGLRRAGDKVYGAMSCGVELTSGIILHRESKIGEDLHLIHGWNIKIHPKTVIGDRVGIMHDVTIGTSPHDVSEVPIIGNDVFIGTGARILGAVKIGDRARIAANTLVISDVPPDTTAIGVPAKILRYTGRPSGAGEPTSK